MRLLPTLELARLYDESLRMSTDIREHLPTLCGLAAQCDHVTEFGTRDAHSTAAFAFARPQSLHCYDIQRRARAAQVQSAAIQAGIEFHYHLQNTTTALIEETDLLFIDTLHTYEQVVLELSANGNRSRRWLVFHDTESCGTKGDMHCTRGILPAIAEFVALNPHWKPWAHFTNNNGLTVYRRI